MLRYDELVWTFCINAPKQYELILRDFSSNYIFYSGYRSNNLRDILYAMWYQNGAKHCVRLTPRQIYLLNDVKNVSQRDYAAYVDGQL